MNENSIILLTHEYPPKRGGAGTYCEELVHACGELNLPIEAWVPEYAKEQGSEKIVPIARQGQSGLDMFIQVDPPNLKKTEGKDGPSYSSFGRTGKFESLCPIRMDDQGSPEINHHDSWNGIDQVLRKSVGEISFSTPLAKGAKDSRPINL